MAIKQKRLWPERTARNVGAAASCNAILSDLIDNSCGLELLGCDDSCSTTSRDVIGSALHLRNFQNGDLNSIDYSSLHDECIESLLHEQSQQLKQQQQKDRYGDFQDDASGSLGFDSVDDVDQNHEDSRKRRRPVKLSRRRTPPRFGRISTHSTEASVSTISFADLDSKQFQDPSSYFHPHCRMQKDKGLGEPVGSNICAKGREACLDKLRAKMRLLAKHALSETSKASVKRKNAAVSERNSNFVETRSLVELRMGFLSMQYGVLLRWDAGNTGTIILIVLRKMCHDTFLPRKPIVVSPPKPLSTSSSEMGIGSRQSDRIRASLLKPPFLVQTPAVFSASALEVRVASASGLNPRSTWIIQLAYEDCLENFVLSPAGSSFVPIERDLCLTRVLRETQAPTTLEVKLFERRRRQQRRLVIARRVPLDGLQPQYTRGHRHYKRIPLALTHDSKVHLEVIFMSDSLAWLQDELQTRKIAQEQTAAEVVADEGDAYGKDYGSWNWLLCCAF